MTVIRDSGYPRAASGNVAVDFVWGNLPGQTNDDRSGSSISYNATGGGTGSGSPDYETAVVTAASGNGTNVTYTAANEFQANQIVTVTGLTSTVAITAISASAGVVTYATASTTGLFAGQTIVVTGSSTAAYNGTLTILAVNTNTSFTVTSGSTGSTSTATGTYASAYNLTGTIISTSLSSSQFLVANTTQDRTVTGETGTGTAVVGNIPGLGADYGWSTTTDYTSNLLTEAQPTKAVGQAGTYTVPNDNVVNLLNGYEAFPNNAANKNAGFNPAYTLQATITGASSDGTTVTYVANNHFTTGQTVTITGLYNYVTAGSSQPIATQYYAKTYTTLSAFNLSAVTIASATATGFTVTNAAADSAITGVAGTAVVTVAASSSTGTVPTVTGKTLVEADRLLGVSNFNTGTVTYTTSGATSANAGTVYSQSLSSTQTLGATVNLVVYRLVTGENAGTQAGTYTY